ncbi:hypothetical protein OQA88_3022 [Cercophora sp. LCS_1]
MNHFLKDSEDIRINISTEPFTNDGDFIHPCKTGECECTGADYPQDTNTDFEYPGGAMNADMDCLDHACCVGFETVEPCKWAIAMRRKFKYGLREPTFLHLEGDCPNHITLQTYFPVVNGEPQPDHHKMFPVEGVLWCDWPFDTVAEATGNVAEAQAQEDTVLDLIHNQSEFFWTAMEMFDIKKAMQATALPKARAYIEQLEADFANGVEIDFVVADEVMQGFLNVLFIFEQDIAGKYSHFLQLLSDALQVIEKYPAEGETLTSLDGSFSISHQRLQLAGADAHVIVRECSGPLNVFSKFNMRYCKLKRRVENSRKRKRAVRDVDGDDDFGRDIKRLFI